MKVKVLSDLHLEFDPDNDQFDPGEGDVLILAGDICVASNYDNYHQFFEKCVKGYNKVFYVMGNHEHYYGDFQETFWILNHNLPSGITILNNRSELYNGVHFIGATLWTNQDNLNYAVMKQSQECMNDYHQISKSDGRSLSVLDTIDDHMFSREWMSRTIPDLDGDVFVITHHAPSIDSVKGRYVHNSGAYASDMSDLINKNPNIKYWAHGHIHHNNDYHVGQCHIISNPRGYFKYEENADFNPDMAIDIPDQS